MSFAFTSFFPQSKETDKMGVSVLLTVYSCNVRMGNTLLIAGTTNSPKSVEVTDKKRDNGSYLDGISSDLHNMKKYVNNQNITNIITQFKIF